MVEREFGVEIRGTPHIQIYDPDGKIVAKDLGFKRAGYNKLIAWMNEELKKEWEQNQES